MKMVKGKMTAEFFYDSVGRRRKLSDNTMRDICKQFRNGSKVGDLAFAYGVSKALIYTITYNTPRQADFDSERAREARRQARAERVDALSNPGSAH